RYLPEEFDAYALVRLMVPYRGELRAMMDGPEPVVLRLPEGRGRIWDGRGPGHVLLDTEPNEPAELLLATGGANFVVVHGRGRGGRLWRNGAAVATQALVDHVLRPHFRDGTDVLLLAHDADISARELAMNWGTYV